MYIGLSKTVSIQGGRYGAVVTLSVYQSRGREFDPPLLKEWNDYETDKTETNRTKRLKNIKTDTDWTDRKQFKRPNEKVKRCITQKKYKKWRHSADNNKY
jgi:hypothetical protein